MYTLIFHIVISLLLTIILVTQRSNNKINSNIDKTTRWIASSTLKKILYFLSVILIIAFFSTSLLLAKINIDIIDNNILSIK